MKITATITTYNRLERLKFAIASVENQTLPPDELIIVDDNSSDGTKEFCENFRPNFNFKYIRNDENKGACFCRNKAIENAIGDYIAFLDDDDEWEREKLCVQKEFAQEGFDFIYTAVRINNDSKIYFHRRFPVVFGNFAGITSTMMISVNFLRKIGGFDHNIPALQDYELVIRLVKNKAKIKGVKIPLVKYYLCDSGNLSGSSGKFFAAAKIILSKTPLLIKPLQFLGVSRIFAEKIFKSKQFRQDLWR